MYSHEVRDGTFPNSDIPFASYVIPAHIPNFPFSDASQICHTPILCNCVVSHGTFPKLLMFFSRALSFLDCSCDIISHVQDTRGLCAAVTRDAIHWQQSFFRSRGVCKVPLFAVGASLAAWKKFHVQPLKEYYLGRQRTNTIWQRHRHIGVNKGIKRHISCYRWVDLRKCLALSPGPSLRRILKKSLRASGVCQAPPASSRNPTSLRHA